MIFSSDKAYVLDNVQFLVHEFNGETNWKNPFAVCITFSNGECVTVKTASDYESVGLSRGCEALQEQDIGEYGYARILDANHLSPWDKIVGSGLIKLENLISDSWVIGVNLTFENGTVYLMNLGDDLYVFDQEPSKIIADENIKRTNIYSI